MSGHFPGNFSGSYAKTPQGFSSSSSSHLHTLQQRGQEASLKGPAFSTSAIETASSYQRPLIYKLLTWRRVAWYGGQPSRIQALRRLPRAVAHPQSCSLPLMRTGTNEKQVRWWLTASLLRKRPRAVLHNRLESKELNWLFKVEKGISKKEIGIQIATKTQ